MNKWTQSFLLHPFANRFNLLYLLGWFVAGVGTDLPHVFLIGLGLEAAYLAIRATLDRSDNPHFLMRRLPGSSKRRFLNVARKSAAIERDFQAADPQSQLLNHSLAQAKRLTRVFLDLLLMDHRMSRYINSIRENFDQKILQLKSKLPGATGRTKSQIEWNIEIYEKRREKYFEMEKKRKVIEGQLDVIENTLNLLADTALGLSSPGDSTEQVELLMTNMEDAEIFVNDIRELVPESSRIRGG